MSLYKPGRPRKYNPTTGKGRKPEARPGEYRIRNSKGEIIYVGESSNLKRRMDEHAYSGKLATGSDPCTFEYKNADRRYGTDARREHERLKIAQHAPSGNRSSGGEGRKAKTPRKAG